MLYVRKLSEDATIPTKSPDGSFLELYSAEEVHLDPREKKLIRTNLQLKVPRGTCGRITTLPNYFLTNGVDAGQTAIPRNFEGEVCVILSNHVDEVFTVYKGDKIAGLLCEKIMQPRMKVVNSIEYSANGKE